MNRHFSKSRLTRLAILLGTVFVVALPVMAQENLRSQANFQFMGLIPKDSTGTDLSGNPITEHATRSGGFLAGYTFNLNRWAAVEGDYGYSRDTQNFSSLFGPSAVQTRLHEMTVAFVVRMPVSVARLHPYALGETGALRFDPTNNSPSMVPGALAQTKPVFLYGGGVNVDLRRNFGVRVDYRGLLSRIPDFKLATLTVGRTTHLAEPSVGVYVRF